MTTGNRRSIVDYYEILVFTRKQMYRQTVDLTVPQVKHIMG